MNKSKYQSLIVFALLPVLVIGICVATSGCGGGANAVTTVTIKPAELTASGDNGEVDGGEGGEVKPVATGEPGSLVGRFTFNGTAPSLSPLVQKGAAVANAEFCSAQDVPNQSLVVGDDGGIANVFIYMEKAPKGYEPSEELEPVVFDQKFCTFEPHGLVVQTEQTILLKNDDGAPHNTNIETVRNTKFNQVVSAHDREGVAHEFVKPEITPVRVKCDFHAWMSAALLIVDHPYAACSKADGTFEIKNIPPGDYVFRVWHESAKNPGLLERGIKVKIKSGEPSTIEKSYGIGDFPKI